jgi:exodeoxyribonuclease VII large subunit
LWVEAFNDEILARAIFACTTPIVSAVGHETDFTIADFVADLRCATPTHAAQSVVPDVNEVRQGLGLHERRIHRQIKSTLSKQHLLLSRLAKKLKEPRVILFQLMQRVDDLSMRMGRLLNHALGQNKNKLKGLSNRLSAKAPHVQLAQKRALLEAKSERLQHAMKRLEQKASERLSLGAAKLLALSPLQVLARGYAVTYQADAQGEFTRVVTHTRDVEIDQTLNVRVSDGSLEVVVKGKQPC